MEKRPFGQNKKLNELIPGQKAIIMAIKDKPSVTRRRILDMGITVGTSILVKKVAPLGDPMNLYVRGYALCIRKEEAKNIFVLVMI